MLLLIPLTLVNRLNEIEYAVFNFCRSSPFQQDSVFRSFSAGVESHGFQSVVSYV